MPAIGYKQSPEVLLRKHQRWAAAAIGRALGSLCEPLQPDKAPRRGRPRISQRYKAKGMAYDCWRLTCLERDGYNCRDCGSEGVHVHHLAPVATYPDLMLEPNNGITLCRRCHRKRHPELPAVLFREAA